jgi:hypothetical protein
MKTGTRRRATIKETVSVFVLVIVFSLAGCLSAAWGQVVKSVDSVGMTVSDMDRSVEFFSKALAFEKVSESEVAGNEYERLQGVFGARMKIVPLLASRQFQSER